MSLKLEAFLSSSHYKRAVDIKKLKFIYSAIERYAVSRGKDVESLSILEVGCGRGGIVFSLASLGCQVRAFDLDETFVDMVENERQRRGISNLKVTVDNGYTFDDGNKYDIIVASEVFEHVTDPTRLAANTVAKLVDGGMLIITTPNGYGPWELKNRINPVSYLRECNLLRRLLGKPLSKHGSGWGHCQCYTKSKLMDLFSAFPLRLTSFGKSDSILSTLGFIYQRSSILGEIDIRLADMLPSWFACGWYFVFEVDTGNQ